MRRIVIAIVCLLACCMYAGAQQTDRLHVVIVNGGMNKLMNHERYFNDCAFLYRTLRQQHHVPKRCITLLMSDGGDPARDMLLDGAMGFASSPDDLDGDGERDVFLSATAANVAAVLDSLSATLTPQDYLLLFFMDHGGCDADGPFLWMWGGDRLYASQLAARLDAFQVASMVVVMGQCYGGAFIPLLERQGRVVITACAADEQSWACPDRCADEFVFHWTCALAGHDPEGNAVSADSDGDGQVSLHEAFCYARDHDRRQETPQYSSTPWELGSQWTLPWAMTDGLAPTLLPSPTLPRVVYSLSGQPSSASQHGIAVVRGAKILKKP